MRKMFRHDLRQKLLPFPRGHRVEAGRDLAADGVDVAQQRVGKIRMKAVKLAAAFAFWRLPAHWKSMRVLESCRIARPSAASFRPHHCLGECKRCCGALNR